MEIISKRNWVLKIGMGSYSRILMKQLSCFGLASVSLIAIKSLKTHPSDIQPPFLKHPGLNVLLK